MTVTSAPVVDARGMRCPMPVLRLRRAMQADSSACAYTLLTDDPAALADVPAFVRDIGWHIADRSIEGKLCRWQIVRDKPGEMAIDRGASTKA